MRFLGQRVEHWAKPWNENGTVTNAPLAVLVRNLPGSASRAPSLGDFSGRAGVRETAARKTTAPVHIDAPVGFRDFRALPFGPEAEGFSP